MSRQWSEEERKLITELFENLPKNPTPKDASAFYQLFADRYPNRKADSVYRYVREQFSPPSEVRAVLLSAVRARESCDTASLVVDGLTYRTAGALAALLGCHPSSIRQWSNDGFIRRHQIRKSRGRNSCQFLYCEEDTRKALGPDRIKVCDGVSQVSATDGSQQEAPRTEENPTDLAYKVWVMKEARRLGVLEISDSEMLEMIFRTLNV